MPKIKLTIVFVILMVAAISFPVNAHLVPMSWGFPVMVQNASLTGLQGSTASTSDLETSNIAFPTTSTGGVFGSSFPTIGQNSRKNNLLSNFMFQRQNQNKLFAYPYLSIGGSPIPGMGFV